MKRKMTKISLFAAAMLSVGIVNAQQTNSFNNGTMANWHSYTAGGVNLQTAEGWHSTDSLVSALGPLAGTFGYTIDAKAQLFQTNDGHGDSTAAQLFNRDLGSQFGVTPGMMTNAGISVDIGAAMGGAPLTQALTLSGGEVVSQRVASVSAWLKTGDSSAIDSFSITVLAMLTDGNDLTDTVGTGNMIISPDLPDYTQITVPIHYTDSVVVPQRLIVMISSGTGIDTATPMQDYNSVKIDDVSYTLEGASGIKIPLMNENEMLVYPVPASNDVYFNLKSQTQPSDYILRITDIQGRVISQETLKNQVNRKDVSNWTRGIYFYQLTNTATNRQQAGKFILQ